MTSAPRMTTVTLDRISRASVQVELPLDCPKCGHPFDEDGALLEEGYCATNQPCYVAIVDGESRIDGYEESESVYDIGLVVGYQCAACRSSVVSTEMPVQTSSLAQDRQEPA